MQCRCCCSLINHLPFLTLNSFIFFARIAYHFAEVNSLVHRLQFFTRAFLFVVICIKSIHITGVWCCVCRFGVVLDGERGRRPHWRSTEQMLSQAIKDIQPPSVQFLPIGTRVCAHWSPQYRCFYPGSVTEGES